jgi:hypothetical protein
MKICKATFGYLLFYFVHISHAQVTFSEIMFNPATNEYHDEYVEVFNLSHDESINLEGWIFSDGIADDRIILFRGSSNLPPRTFAVILDGSYAGNSQIYDSEIPHSVAIFQIDNNSFGSNGLSNGNDENLILIDQEGDTVSIYRYSHQNEQGFSDEKVLLDAPNSPQNWANSKKIGGTPGYRNTVTPFAIDPFLESDAIFIREPVFADEVFTIRITAAYAGTLRFAGEVTIYLYANKDRPVEDSLLIKHTFWFDSDIDNSVSLIPEPLSAGIFRFTAILESGQDQNVENNRISRSVTILSRSTSIHLNEIKFLTQESEPEWIELINNGTKPVFLKSWMIADKNDTFRIDSAVYIYPLQLKIVAAHDLSPFFSVEDSLKIIVKNFLNLNNDADELVLMQPDSTEVERVNYNIDWLEGEQNRNVSLERIHPLLHANVAENWGPCVSTNTATPALKNSIFQSLQGVRNEISVSPNPFSPDGDGFDDVVIISGTLPEKSVRLRIRIFDITGRLISTVSDNQFSGNTFSVVWDGKNNRGENARIGIYIILFEGLETV